MLSILNHRAIGSLGPLDLRTHDTQVVAPWAIVVREAVSQVWVSRPPDLAELAHWFNFDQIAREYGGADAFDQTVKELVGDCFFAAWQIGRGAKMPADGGS